MNICINDISCTVLGDEGYYKLRGVADGSCTVHKDKGYLEHGGVVDWSKGYVSS